MKKAKRYEAVTEVLQSAREDHYDGQNSIYRLSASLKYDTSLPSSEFCIFINNLREELYDLEVIPSRIFIYRSGEIHIDWYPRHYQVLKSKVQYANLMLEFSDFIYSLSLDLEVLATVDDDPEIVPLNTPHNRIKYEPTFNEDCFGTVHLIEIEIF